MDNSLDKARDYEHKWIENSHDTLCPVFHFVPPVGWLNDPNGFSWYQGKYHLFYQYHPYSTHWGSIHWGHAVSEDLLHWTYLPAALAPEDEYDRNGCFSGSALTMTDGKHFLMYTGYVYDENDPCHRGIQTQNVAVGDGLDYEKFPLNPVIRNEDIPLGGSQYDFRDPKVWMDDDGSIYAVIASGNDESGARILVFKSHDGYQWEYSHLLIENSYRFGNMWECPDLFTLNTRDVLLVNAMDMTENAPEFHAGNNGLYFIGSIDPASFSFREECVHTLDHGMDFYAGQTLLAPDGRRILIGWMQNPSTTEQRTSERIYYGQMSVPRELHIRDGILLQWPVRELDQFHGDLMEYQNQHMHSEERKLPGVRGRVLDLFLNVKNEFSEETFDCFEIRFAQSGDFYASFSVEPCSGKVRVSRRHCGPCDNAFAERETKLFRWDGALSLRLILDINSAELFLNDGEIVFSMVLESDLEADDITFISKGNLILDVKTYKLDL